MKLKDLLKTSRVTPVKESMDREQAEWYARYLKKKEAAQDTNTIEAYSKIVRDVSNKVKQFVPDIVADGGGYDDVKNYVVTVFSEDYDITSENNAYFDLLVKSVMDDVCGSKDQFDEAKASVAVAVQPQIGDAPSQTPDQKPAAPQQTAPTDPTA